MAIRDKGVPPEARTAAVVGSAVLAEEGALAAGVGSDGILEPTARSQWQLFRRRFFRHKLAVAAGVVLLLLYLAVIFAPQLAPYELNPPLDSATLADARQGPSADHWFGTDQLGRDQLTRVLYAGRVSLAIGLSVAVASTLIGVTIGSIAGYLGRWPDQLLMRATDLFLVVPSLAVLMIAQKGLAGKKIFGFDVSSQTLIILILSILFWQYIARVVRGLFLSLKEKEFVEAARACGASTPRIIIRHMLPNAIGPIVVNTTLVVGIAILTESTLSFLGFGVQPPDVSWGDMLAKARDSVGTDTAYLIYFPGLFILLTVLAVNFLGDGLRDAFDPQSRR